MLSKLLALWRTLSILILILAGWIIWQGIKVSREAAVVAQPQDAAAVLATAGAPYHFRDTLSFDLRQAGFRQDNYMGIKGKVAAVIPAHPLVRDSAGDSSSVDTAHTFVVLSYDPAFVGPVVNEYLNHMSSSLGSSNYNVKGGEGDHGAIDAQARALMQTLGEKLKDHLRDTVSHREIVDGVGAMRTAADFSELGELSGNIPMIRAGYLPSASAATRPIAAGVFLILLDVAIWVFDLKRRRRLAEEEAREEEEPPQSLV